MNDKEYPDPPEKNDCGGYYCSEQHGHIDCQDIETHCCSTPGLTMGNAILTEITNAHGQHYWKAVEQIGTLFGFEVEGEISAIGRTKEECLDRLANERKKLHESIWD